MHNCSIVIDQTIWGMHLNFDEYLASPPSFPDWLNTLQQQDWQRRGIVVWEADLHMVTHLCGRYALELLEQMLENDEWKSNGFVIGSPTYKLSSETVNGTVTFENKIELTSNQAMDFYDFLSAHKKLLEHIAICDEEAAKDALRAIFPLIAVYGRQVREGKKDNKPTEITKTSIHPTFIPRGKYFTVHQAAQVCHATSKQIRAWIRKGKLEALDLPSLGIIIEAGKLNDFLYEIRSIQDSPVPERSHEP